MASFPTKTMASNYEIQSEDGFLRQRNHQTSLSHNFESGNILKVFFPQLNQPPSKGLISILMCLRVKLCNFFHVEIEA